MVCWDHACIQIGFGSTLLICSSTLLIIQLSLCALDLVSSGHHHLLSSAGTFLRCTDICAVRSCLVLISSFLISDCGQFTVPQLCRNIGTASWFISLIFFPPWGEVRFQDHPRSTQAFLGNCLALFFVIFGGPIIL